MPIKVGIKPEPGPAGRHGRQQRAGRRGRNRRRPRSGDPLQAVEGDGLSGAGENADPEKCQRAGTGEGRDHAASRGTPSVPSTRRSSPLPNGCPSELSVPSIGVISPSFARLLVPSSALAGGRPANRVASGEASRGRVGGGAARACQSGPFCDHTLRTRTGVDSWSAKCRRSSGSEVKTVAQRTAAVTTTWPSTTSAVPAFARSRPTSCDCSGANATTSQPRRRRCSCTCRDERLTWATTEAVV